MNTTMRALRTLIREAVREFKDKAEFEAALAALKKGAADANQYADMADAGGSYYSDKKAAGKIEDRVKELEDAGRAQGFLDPLPGPRVPSDVEKKIEKDFAAKGWFRLMKADGGIDMADAWDKMVAAAADLEDGGANAKELSAPIAAEFGIDRAAVSFHLRKLKGGSSVSGADMIEAMEALVADANARKGK